jgi:oligopeptide/dipeptide ABC transporter ATP-binding protein
MVAVYQGVGSMSNQNFLSIQKLKMHFPISGGLFGRPSSFVYALDGVNLEVAKGETVGVVGESGCGKTTLGRCILRLIEPTAGSVVFEGKQVLALGGEELRKLRRDMQIIFQDPYSSLNPRKTVRHIVGEAFTIHNLLTQKARGKRIAELLRLVGLLPEHSGRYPHEFSGGQRQRICIARALALNPKLIIADEPVSALDVSIQAQILNLLVNLQKQFELTYIFISHDLSVVRHLCDRVAVMYLGKLVELANSQKLYKDPKHPYTQALLSAVPVPNPLHKKNRINLGGDVPSPIDPPDGCALHPRCPYVEKVCKDETPPLRELSGGHLAACHFA